MVFSLGIAPRSRPSESRVLSAAPRELGTPGENRTRDLRFRKPPLCLLSYRRVIRPLWLALTRRIVLVGRDSNPLHLTSAVVVYKVRPFIMAEVEGVEPPRGLSSPTGFQNRLHKPLGHTSMTQPTTASSFDRSAFAFRKLLSRTPRVERDS
jgi:hypothetical protein